MSRVKFSHSLFLCTHYMCVSYCVLLGTRTIILKLGSFWCVCVWGGGCNKAPHSASWSDVFIRLDSEARLQQMHKPLIKHFFLSKAKCQKESVQLNTLIIYFKSSTKLHTTGNTKLKGKSAPLYAPERVEVMHSLCQPCYCYCGSSFSITQLFQPGSISFHFIAPFFSETRYVNVVKLSVGAASLLFTFRYSVN